MFPMAELIWADYVILAIVALSALVSVLRGFVKEALSLLGWVLAFWCAISFTHLASPWFEPYVEVPSIRQAVAFGAIFVVVMLLSGIIIHLVGLLMQKTGISGTDRMLGVLFGAGRGVVIVAILVLFSGFTALPNDPWWSQSVLIPHFEALAVQIRDLLPPEVASQLTV